mmetsp:Transcript_58147/g.96031  ORF Transcript_58147/g.96031 Transcript_58147/m.96031 type:complete len:138 (+) Transcript_58147:81-494(+)
MTDNLFMLGNSARPVRVEFGIDADTEVDEVVPVVSEEPPPHFAQPGTLEFDFALKWRELALVHLAEKEKLRELQRQERQILWQEQQSIYKREMGKMQKIEILLSGQVPQQCSSNSTAGTNSSDARDGLESKKRPRDQ